MSIEIFDCLKRERDILIKPMLRKNGIQEESTHCGPILEIRGGLGTRETVEKPWERNTSKMAEEVEFVSDEDVPELKKRRQKQTSVDSDTPVSGSTVFGFHTPKRRGALAEAASSAIHNKTPAHHIQTAPPCDKRKTPKSNKKATKGIVPTSNGDQAIPTSGCHNENNTSGYSLRHRRKAVLLKGVERDSDSEDSDSNSGSVAADETASRGFNKATKRNTNQIEEAREEYFEQQSSKCLTSDHTLSKLNMPRMDQEKLMSQLNEVSSSHPKERFDLYHKLQSLFDKWMFHLRNGFNILLYGLGSKRVLLDQFRSSKLSAHLQVVVNGFFPSLTIKNVLNIITEEILMHDGTFKSVTDQCDFIRQGLGIEKRPEEVFVIIHNIDGSMLRSKKTQTILSLLAEVDAIHVIASIDHINAPLIWNHTQLGRFNWSWFDVTSFEPYKEETSYENSLLVQHTGALALSSLVHVFRSLTPNARGIFILIAGHQLEERDNNCYIGLSFNACYSKCREQFLVNSDSTLKAQLIEFRDHKLITSKKGTDGVEYLYIPVDSATLKQFVEDQQNNNR
ncbi:Origin recognition complex subunit 2 [Desmophyllum pertusum]|uniref:Origin recognition complex subunit 2 n=1 Tax=Desmophyllum pertusum TaxID=174260 RepID=A0A9W9ZH59_9CNID|nr:Origin recognition complex subunit 2 [Desmophyllum pertusum]